MDEIKRFFYVSYKMEDCYNLYTNAFVSKTYNNCIDYVFLTDEETPNPFSNQLNLLRVTNVITEFLVIKFPGIPFEEFENQIKSYVRQNNCAYSTVEMKDSQLCTFEHEYKYIAIRSQNIWALKECHRLISLYAYAEYSRIVKDNGKYYRVTHNGDEVKRDEIDYYDVVMYKYTETPFRYTLNSLNVNNIPYYMSTKYDFPNIGAIKINLSKLNKIDPNHQVFDGQMAIKSKYFKRVYTVDFKRLVGKDVDSRLYQDSDNSSLIDNLKTIAYDIETYNPGENPDSTKTSHRIICIGFSIFGINNPKPIKRLSYITKEFDKIDIEKYKCEPDTINEKSKTHIYRLYDYLPETNFDNVKTDFGATDTTTYKCCGIPLEPKSESENELDYVRKVLLNEAMNEKRLLKCFIEEIKVIKPFIVTGFNNWTFDDLWIYNKCKQYKLEGELLGALSFYINTTAKFQTICPKLDGDISKDGQYKTFVGGFTLFHDVMLAAKKENPKKFSQRNRANLETMLSVFNIVSPYNGKTLTKTDMKIAYMFKCWKESKHIYLVAKYCCQDAWITGCLAISRNMFGDLVEMSNMTYTTFHDSLHKAVGTRVTNTIQWYAHHSNIAYYDSPDNESRSYRLHSAVGKKYFDKRTLIGGAVKNKRNGREFFIQALDFSSMYPSQKEGSNTDTSSRVDEDILIHPENYGLKIIDKYYLEDMYTARWFYELESEKTGERFNVEQFFCEYKVDPKELKDLNEKFHKIRKNETVSESLRKCIEKDLLRRMLNLIHGEDENYTNKKLFGTSCDKNIQKEKSLYWLLKDFDKTDYPISDTYTIDERQLVEKYKAMQIPARVLFPIYFIQSPKDEKTNLPIIHYSLKEKMLSDLRAKRSAVKKIKPRNLTEKKQLNAKQLAIKIVMNSEYGQTGSDLFAHYDSDVGAAVTFASRKCIAELTSCLLSEHFYVDDSYQTNEHFLYLQEICKRFGDESVKLEYISYEPTFESALEGTQRSKEDVDRIKTCFDENGNFVQSIDIFSEIDYKLPPRRLTTSKIYTQLRNQYKNDPQSKIMVWRLTLPKSELVYQDTDSNYYTNEHLISLWDVLNPDTINEIMKTLFEHDSLLGDLISGIINRRPIGVGWEGAFVVARYLNKKKKYYGKKWTIPGEGGLMKSTITIPRSKDYEMNEYEKEHSKAVNDETVEITYDWRHLPEDYEQYLTLKKGDNYQTYNCLIPYRDGSYFKVKDFPSEGVDPLDYVNSHGIKCTGVDLARRDQFKFININNMLMYQNDLKYCEADVNDINTLEVKNPIKYKLEKVRLTSVVEKLMNDFKNVTFGDYELEAYTRTKSMKSDKKTEVKDIVNKLKEEIMRAPTQEIKIALEGVMPHEGERTSYVMISPNNKYSIVSGDKVVDKGYILGHLLNKPLEYNSNGLRQYRVLLKDEYEELTSRKIRPKIFKKIDAMYVPMLGEPEPFTPNTFFVIEYIIMTKQMIFDSLDLRYYYERLADVLCNYVVIEHNPNIVNYINGVYAEEHPEKSDKEIEGDMDSLIKDTRKQLVKAFIDAAFPQSHEVKKRVGKRVKTTRISSIPTCPNLTDLRELEKKVGAQSGIEPAYWEYLMGQPNYILAEIRERRATVKQRKQIDQQMASDLVDLYNRLETHIIKKFNLDNSKVTCGVCYDTESGSRQKFKILFNINAMKQKKRAAKMIVLKSYPAEMFGNIDDISRYIITQLQFSKIDVGILKKNEEDQPFTILFKDVEFCVAYIKELFEIADMFID